MYILQYGVWGLAIAPENSEVGVTPETIQMLGCELVCNVENIN